MALPAIAAAAARGTAVIGRGLGRVGRALPGMKGPGPQPEEGAPAEAEEEEEEEEEEETPGEAAARKTSAITSPEGVLMLFVGGLLDILSIIGAILILAFGVGLIFAKIVYIVGLVIVGAWAFFRSGALPAMPGKKGKGKIEKKAGRTFMNFLKRQWPKLGGKVIPAIGDALPLWTWTIYSELTST